MDKSKSVKSVLMRLFSSVNDSIEGTDCINACYGGTQALFNAVDWCQSAACGGRRAIVIMGDIAAYEPGSARATGGAGALALLIGVASTSDELALTFDAARYCCMRDTVDFFKPLTRRHGTYPVVDGPLSLQSYMTAVRECYDKLVRSEPGGCFVLKSINWVQAHRSTHSGMSCSTVRSPRW